MYFDQKLDDKSHSFLMRIREDFIKTVRRLEFQHNSFSLPLKNSDMEVKNVFPTPTIGWKDEFGIGGYDKHKICDLYNVKMTISVDTNKDKNEWITLEICLFNKPNIVGDEVDDEGNYTDKNYDIDKVWVNLGVRFYEMKEGYFQSDRITPNISYRLVEDEFIPPKNWRPFYSNDTYTKYNGEEHLLEMLLSFKDFIEEKDFRFNILDKPYMGIYYNKNFTEYFNCNMDDYNHYIEPKFDTETKSVTDLFMLSVRDNGVIEDEMGFRRKKHLKKQNN